VDGSCPVLRRPRGQLQTARTRRKGAYPDIEFDILIRNGLDVEADCRDGSDGLVELELVQYR
jgi:hypothetical protein